jgi:hypothetical protein
MRFAQRLRDCIRSAAMSITIVSCQNQDFLHALGVHTASFFLSASNEPWVKQKPRS